MQRAKCTFETAVGGERGRAWLVRQNARIFDVEQRGGGDRLRFDGWNRWAVNGLDWGIDGSRFALVLERHYEQRMLRVRVVCCAVELGRHLEVDWSGVQTFVIHDS